MTVDMNGGAVCYSDILAFMREQTSVLQDQKIIIKSLSEVVNSQRLHIDLQDKKITQLVQECALIRTSSTEIAKIIVNTEISAHKKREETSTNEMHKKIRALKVESDAMKAVAMSTTIIVAGCISYPLIPVAIVGCTILANVS